MNRIYHIAHNAAHATVWEFDPDTCARVSTTSYTPDGIDDYRERRWTIESWLTLQFGFTFDQKKPCGS